jgi:hypothetical protein
VAGAGLGASWSEVRVTGSLLSDVQTARHRGMTLVRLRDDPLSLGLSVPPAHPSRDRVHIVPNDVRLGLDATTNADPVTTCCELVFEAGSVETVPWGTAAPHEECVRTSGHPRSFVSRLDREARDLLRRKESDEDIAASILLLERTFEARGRDWSQDDEGDVWTYEASFNGVFPGDRLCPRGRDIGLERLTVDIPYPGTVNIHACGVRDGCSRHLVRTETFSLDDMEAVERRIASHEIAATSIPLMELAWCLVTGDCSATPVYEACDPILWPKGQP